MSEKKRLVYKWGDDGKYHLVREEAGSTSPTIITSPTKKTIPADEDLFDLGYVFKNMNTKEESPVKKEARNENLIAKVRTRSVSPVLDSWVNQDSLPTTFAMNTQDARVLPRTKLPAAPSNIRQSIDETDYEFIEPTSPTAPITNVSAIPLKETVTTPNIVAAANGMFMEEIMKHLNFNGLSFVGGVTFCIAAYILSPALLYFAGELFKTLRIAVIWIVITTVLLLAVGIVKPGDVVVLKLSLLNLKYGFPIGAKVVTKATNETTVPIEEAVTSSPIVAHAVTDSLNKPVPMLFRADDVSSVGSIDSTEDSIISSESKTHLFPSESPVKSQPHTSFSDKIDVPAAVPEGVAVPSSAVQPAYQRRNSTTESIKVKPFHPQVYSNHHDHLRTRLNDELSRRLQRQFGQITHQRANSNNTNTNNNNNKHTQLPPLMKVKSITTFGDDHGGRRKQVPPPQTQPIPFIRHMSVIPPAGGPVTEPHYYRGGPEEYQNVRGPSPGAFQPELENQNYVHTLPEDELPLINEITVQESKNPLNQNNILTEDVWDSMDKRMARVYNQNVKRNADRNAERPVRGGILRLNSTKLVLATRLNYLKFLSNVNDDY